MNRQVLIALIGIIPACLTAVLGYDQGTKSTDAHQAEMELESKQITFERSNNPSFKELVYPNYGISLLAPISWTSEDAPARLAGGEFNLVQRYEDTKGAIGMNFRLRPVQPNYVNDISAQLANMKETLVANYGNASVEDVTISGLMGKVFTYEVPTGSRRMKVQQYWIRLVPDVQLQITSAQYTDAADAQEFWTNSGQVISSIVIAFDSWQARYKKSAKG